MTTKTCFKCGVEKPLSEFYRHPKMGDGHLNKCKECTRQDVQSNYASRRDQYTAYNRRRRPPKYAHRDLSPLPESERRKRKKASVAVTNAVRDGRLHRLPCAVCGEIKVQGHHEDYDKPLEVVWLCVAHHVIRHAVSVE